MRYYTVCRDQVGGKARVEQMMKLIDYLDAREWMKNDVE
jgi:hypothetical protein